MAFPGEVDLGDGPGFEEEEGTGSEEGILKVISFVTSASLFSGGVWVLSLGLSRKGTTGLYVEENESNDPDLALALLSAMTARFSASFWSSTL